MLNEVHFFLDLVKNKLYRKLYIMKVLKSALLLLTVSLSALTFAQTNTIPVNGNVGIGYNEISSCGFYPQGVE